MRMYRLTTYLYNEETWEIVDAMKIVVPEDLLSDYAFDEAEFIGLLPEELLIMKLDDDDSDDDERSPIDYKDIRKRRVSCLKRKCSPEKMVPNLSAAFGIT